MNKAHIHIWLDQVLFLEDSETGSGNRGHLAQYSVDMDISLLLGVVASGIRALEVVVLNIARGETGN